MTQVIDIRGQQLVHDRPPVLLDPSGRRARLLTWTGRAIAAIFLLWLVGLVFAGLGLLPSGSLPLGSALVGPAPPALKAVPPITQPDLVGGSSAAQPVGAAAAAVRGSASHPAASTGSRAGVGAPSSPGHGHSAATGNAGKAGGTSSTTASATHPNNGVRAGGSAPGRTVSQSTPGHTKTSGTGSAGQSGSFSHGQQTTTTTTTTTTTIGTIVSPGKSGSSSGRAALR